MNMEQPGLSLHDKKILAIINSQFELAEQIIGPEPAIYHEFNIAPEMDSTPDSPLISRRQQLFTQLEPVTREKINWKYNFKSDRK